MFPVFASAPPWKEPNGDHLHARCNAVARLGCQRYGGFFREAQSVLICQEGTPTRYRTIANKLQQNSRCNTAGRIRLGDFTVRKAPPQEARTTTNSYNPAATIGPASVTMAVPTTRKGAVPSLRTTGTRNPRLTIVTRLRVIHAESPATFSYRGLL